MSSIDSSPPRTVLSIDALNGLLMLLSAAAALVAPYHLFTFSWGVLGPLHYLTEISWLHDRGFFLEAPRRTRPWVLLVAAAAVLATLRLPHVHYPFHLGMLLLAAGLVSLRRPWWGLVGVILGLGLVLPTPWVAYLVLLPTMVHVLVFTWTFMVQGTLRRPSPLGLLNAALLPALALLMALPFVPTFHVPPSPAIVQAYNYPLLNATLLGLGGTYIRADLFAGTKAIAVMRLVAFAYTYHYLNWFSKTTIIGWARAPKRRTAALFTLWGLIVAFSFRSSRLGFLFLGTLSSLHVVLEYPLNARTLGALGRELWGRRPRLVRVPVA